MNEDRRIERVIWGIIIAVALVSITSTIAYRRYAARQRVEQAKIIQDAKTQRTKERSDTLKAIVPWAKEPKP